MKKLTDKQAAFVREYLVDLNAAAAARRAGYSEKTARRMGHENLTKPDIAAAIQAAMDERAQRTEITADRVLQELARIGFADIRDLFEWDEERAAFIPSRDLTEDEAAAISEVQSETTTYTETDKDYTETKIKLKLKTYDKLSALEKIGKHLGLFSDRLKVEGRIEHSGAVQFYLPDNSREQEHQNRIAAVTPKPNGNGNGKR